MGALGSEEVRQLDQAAAGRQILKMYVVFGFLIIFGGGGNEEENPPMKVIDG